MPIPPVIFSDLDGALLGETDFSWAPAQPTLERLRAARIPLMFVSSKTREEIEALRAAIHNDAPYAAENGAVIVRSADRRIILGLPARKLEGAARRIAREAGAEIELLVDMSTPEAASATGLPPSRLGPAIRREHSAPFILRSGDPQRLINAANRLNLRIIPGKRFLQLAGPHDKADAVNILARAHAHAFTIGIGDGPNDIPMLRAVDRPIFQGTDPPHDLPDNTHVEPETGPAGWARAISHVLGEHQKRLVAGGA